MADRYWKDEDPVGRRLRIGSGDTAPWMRIVGVAENVRHFGLESAPVREIFVPYRQNAWPVMTIVAKALHTGTPPSVLRDVMRRAYPGLPVTRVQTMSAVIDGSISWRVSYLRLLLLFAGLGLVLSAVGVYGVLAYFVAQRSHELGVRVALGATRPTIVRLVLRQSFIPIAAGVMAGGLASTWSGRLLNDLLFETTPRDPLVIASIGALVLLVGLLASWIPAHRAAGVDPTTILRN
jgi:putative ABC transport system permease protein